MNEIGDNALIVAITGGTGFIGKELAKHHIARGDHVRIFSRRSNHDPELGAAIFYRGDLISPDGLLSQFVAGVDILYHCAGEIRDQGKMHAVHVTGTENLCTAAGGRIGHWVQLSSVGAYGPQTGGVVTEETPVHPAGTYEITKTLSDRIVVKACREGAFSCTILRPSNVYGPAMTNRSLFRMIEMIEKGLFFFIGRPGASANYIHIVNVVEAMMLCGRMPASRGKVFNVSDHLPLEAFVAIIADELGRPCPTLRLPERPVRWLSAVLGSLPGFPLTASRIDAMTNRSLYSIEKIRNELGYAHVMSMEDGIRQLVRARKQSGR